MGFDFAIKLFDTVIDKEYKNPFIYSLPWQWDRTIWAPLAEQNRLGSIPTNFDPDVSSLTDFMYQSGISGVNALKLLGIERVSDTVFGTTDLLVKMWKPQVNPGWFYSLKFGKRLFPDGSILSYPGDETDDYGRTVADFFVPFKSGGYVSVNYYGRQNKVIFPFGNFYRVEKFTGTLTASGRRNDTDVDPLTADTDKNEFQIIFGPGEFSEKLDLTYNVGTGVTSGTLSYRPISNFLPRFSREDIFVNRLSYAQWVTKAGSYELGDYFIGFADESGEAGVIHAYVGTVGTDFANLDPGTITYKYSYEVRFLFNKYVCIPHADEELGFSNGSANQIFPTIYLPILDRSEGDDLDTTSVGLSIDDGAGGWDTWTRVKDFTSSGALDQHFTMNPDTGDITFGDDLNGRIPPIGRMIIVTYHSIPVIEYETAFVKEYNTGKIDLSPVANRIGRGFLYISGFDATPHKIVLETTTPYNDTYGYYGPITPGLDSIYLIATVLSRYNEPVSNVTIQFLDNPAMGTFAAGDTVITDQQGMAVARYDVGASIDNLGVQVHSYKRLFPNPWSSGLHGQLGRILPIENSNIPTWFLDPLTGVVVSSGGLTDNVLVVPKTRRLDVESLKEMYLFIVKNNSMLVPYNPEARLGGRKTLFYKFENAMYSPVFPVNVTELDDVYYVEYDRSLPVANNVPFLTCNATVSRTVRKLVTFNTNDYSFPITKFIVGTELQLASPIPAGYLNQSVTVCVDNGLLVYGNGDYTVAEVIDSNRILLTTELPFDIGDSISVNLHLSDYHVVGYRLIGDSVMDIQAETLTTKSLKSNILTFSVGLSEQQKGAFTLSPGQGGSAIDAATFLKLGRIVVDSNNSAVIINGIETLISSATLEKDGGQTVILRGANFPSTIHIYYGAIPAPQSKDGMPSFEHQMVPQSDLLYQSLTEIRFKSPPNTGTTRFILNEWQNPDATFYLTYGV